MFNSNSTKIVYTIKVVHKFEKGITKINAGSILAIRKAFIPLIRKPTASIIIPPQAVKSAIIPGVVIGNINVTLKNDGITFIPRGLTPFVDIKR